MPANLDTLCKVAQPGEVSIFISPIPPLPKVNLAKVSEPCNGGKAETSSFGAEDMLLEAAEGDTVYTLDNGKVREKCFVCVSKDRSDAC